MRTILTGAKKLHWNIPLLSHRSCAACLPTRPESRNQLDVFAQVSILKAISRKALNNFSNFYPPGARPRKFSKLNWDSVGTVRRSIIIKNYSIYLQPAPRTTLLI